MRLLDRLGSLLRPEHAAAALVDGGAEIQISGEHYHHTLAGVHAAFQPRRYFEIGTAFGETLALATCASLAVDPQFEINRDVASNKPSCLLREVTSDDFFATEDPAALLGGPIDLAFLDGMHHFEFLLRDFINTEPFCHPGSLVLLHDCCPLDLQMSRRSEELNQPLPTKYPGYWTGDVWKMIPVLRTLRPDLRTVVLDSVPTGVVAVTGLKPSDTTLRDAYEDILAQWAPVTLKDYGMARLYEACRFQSAPAWRRRLRPV